MPRAHREIADRADKAAARIAGEQGAILRVEEADRFALHRAVESRLFFRRRPPRAKDLSAQTHAAPRAHRLLRRIQSIRTESGAAGGARQGTELDRGGGGHAFSFYSQVAFIFTAAFRRVRRKVKDPPSQNKD